PAHAAETCIYILVMRLEPVAKRWPQHAGGGARRATLHDEVLAIEEICRVAGVERKPLEARKGCEKRGSPFPPVAKHAIYAKCALAAGKGSYGLRIPTVEIEVAVVCIRRVVAPQVSYFNSVRSTVCGTVPLLFRGKRLLSPVRVGRGLGMTHIDGPVQRQWNFFEHRTIKPLAACLFPKTRVRHAISSLPIPVGIAPERARFIAAGRYEIEILAVSHHKLIYLKRRHLCLVGFILVVPAEALVAARKAHRCYASRNLDHARSRGSSDKSWWAYLPNLLAERQLMQHVGQRLEMH